MKNNFGLLNTIFGWVSFVFALTVYALTIEPTGSLWDCGEFISAAFKLQVVHPPGAPLFLLLGNLFTQFVSNPEKVAMAVNFFSGTLSAFCVMFTFWITTYFAAKLAVAAKLPEGFATQLAIIFAGLVAAGTLTFSDTFWFSAVEAEVYAASSFFMAFTFWCILKWERAADEDGSHRWLIFIGYVIGLAIGVHLLNLLVIPAIVLVYYFKRFNYTGKGLLVAIAIGFVLLFFVQLFVIPGIPSLAAKFDLYFVNTLNMGFGSGVLFFSALLLGSLIAGIIYTRAKNMVHLQTALIAFAFMLIGYSSYGMVVIRSIANTPINMNNPSDALNLVYYLNREQYGDRPLLKGPHYKTQLVGYDKKGDNYIKGDGKYEPAGFKYNLKYDPTDLMLFPRIYDGNDQGHIAGYKEWARIPENAKPRFSHNITFLMRYQLGAMYFRYFMWNFAGRQNDDQKLRADDAFSGNWISGISFIDAMRLGPQDNMPDYLKNNKSRNTYYLLPFLLGVFGLLFHYKNEKNGALINIILFIVTGAMLIVYLNPPPYEPRERDYVFVGSFQVFSMWVGLGVMALYAYLSRKLASTSSAAIAGVIGILAAPALMGAQNWDDHDRSGRYMSRDFARNYLKSCAPNAILFTNGDNDTYPLWYVQNVEGYRTDVRVVNLSLLNASDYVESLRNQQYESAPFKLSFTTKQLWPGTRDRVDYLEQNGVTDPNSFYNLQEVIRFIADDNNPRAKVGTQGGERVSFLPTKKFFIPINKEEVLSKGIVAPEMADRIVNEISFELKENTLTRASLVLLDIIANNLWDRPVYFTTTTGSETYVGLQEYFEMVGLTYKLTPIRTVPTQEMQQAREYGFINTKKMVPLIAEEFTWGGMEDGKMWVDEKMRLVPRVMRGTFIRTARELINKGEKKEAVKLLQVSENKLRNDNLAYDNFMVEMAELYYLCDDKENARRVLKLMLEVQSQKGKFFRQAGYSANPVAQNDLRVANSIAQYIAGVASRFQDEEMTKAAQDVLSGSF